MESIPPIDDAPQSLRNVEVLQRRKAMLALSHVAPLTEYAAKLRGRGSVEVPGFDRTDRGTKGASAIPIRKTRPDHRRSREAKSSGFISRNNDDATAE